MKTKDVLKDVAAGIGLLALAGFAGATAVAANEEREKRENASLGTLSIPSDEMRDLRGRRMILRVKGSEVRKIDPSSFIGSEWLVWGAKFRPYMDKDVTIMEIDDYIEPGKTIPCQYKGKDGVAKRGYVTIMEVSRW